jgi:hypothetical protein
MTTNKEKGDLQCKGGCLGGGITLEPPFVLQVILSFVHFICCHNLNLSFKINSTKRCTLKVFYTDFNPFL